MDTRRIVLAEESVMSADKRGRHSLPCLYRKERDGDNQQGASDDDRISRTVWESGLLVFGI